MSKIVFRNYSKNAVYKLLKEIGQERYNCALKDNDLEQKPIALEGFFVEFEVDTKNINLYHRYPSRVTFFIMSVLGFGAVPNEGWQMYWKQDDEAAPSEF